MPRSEWPSQIGKGGRMLSDWVAGSPQNTQTAHQINTDPKPECDVAFLAPLGTHLRK